MKNATKRSILRWLHLVATIPVLGYIYEPAAEVQQYVDGPRYIFVPLLVVTGYWMYAGAYLAILGVVVWVGAYWLSGFGTALLGQISLLIALKAWRVIRARRSTVSSHSTTEVELT
jgi:hypothetical protein